MTSNASVFNACHDTSHTVTENRKSMIPSNTVASSLRYIILFFFKCFFLNCWKVSNSADARFFESCCKTKTAEWSLIWSFLLWIPFWHHHKSFTMHFVTGTARGGRRGVTVRDGSETTLEPTVRGRWAPKEDMLMVVLVFSKKLLRDYVSPAFSLCNYCKVDWATVG